MSTGLAVFDTTVQETNEWLRAIENDLQPLTRQQAYSALRAVLHVLRDHLTADQVAGLSAQLPMLLRGVFLEGWKPLEASRGGRDPEVFLQEIRARTMGACQRDANDIASSVLTVMADRLDPGEVRKIIQHLPKPLREFWPVRTWAL
jgi:uncharacterized protein (DUF2267 family)